MNQEIEILEKVTDVEIVKTEIIDGEIAEVEIIELEIVEIEEYAKKGEKPPKSKKYVIRIDKEKYTVSVSCMTGRGLLELAGKDPIQNSIYQKFSHGKMEKIEMDESVDFTAPGIERFCTLPLDQTEGA